jgi:hypothetical protein
MPKRFRGALGKGFVHVETVNLETPSSTVVDWGQCPVVVA